MTFKAGVVGAAGFAGIELVRLLLEHPYFELTVATSDSLAGVSLAEAYPAFADVSELSFSSHEDAPLSECDVVFLAVPHTAALDVAPGLVAQGVTVIDLSADFRLKDPDEYALWYGKAHTAVDLLAEAAFGLPEITRDELVSAAVRHAAGEAVIVGCAGCYPTATSLAAAPALAAGFADPSGVVVVDAVSGVTGAGKKASERTHFCFANDSVEAYGVGVHRHTPEIEQILGLSHRLAFTPHLAPLNRGILSTVNIPLDPSKPMPSSDEVIEAYSRYYADSPLVTVLPAGKLPKTSSVAGTCRAHVGAVVNERARMIVAIGAIDNLGKGAAGQAVQCANIVFGLAEETGLSSISTPV